MKIHSGILKLGKKEIEALRVIIEHTERDLSYLGGGTFSLAKTNKEGDYLFDSKEGNKAVLGLDVLRFVIQITE